MLENNILPMPRVAWVGRRVRMVGVGGWQGQVVEGCSPWDLRRAHVVVRMERRPMHRRHAWVGVAMWVQVAVAVAVRWVWGSQAEGERVVVSLGRPRVSPAAALPACCCRHCGQCCETVGGVWEGLHVG